MFFNTSGTSTTSLGSLLQCLTTCLVKKCFLISSPNPLLGKCSVTRGTGVCWSSAAEKVAKPILSCREFFLGCRCMAGSQACGSGWTAAAVGSLVFPGHWSVLSLTVLPPDEPGRNPPIISEEQKEGFQTNVCTSFCIFLQQQPGQNGHFPAVRAPDFLGEAWKRLQGRAHLPRAWQEAMSSHHCLGTVCKANLVGEMSCPVQNPALAASQQEVKPLVNAWTELSCSFYHSFLLFFMQN